MIDTLVDRLRWPAALVRERAASQIGELILEEHAGVCEQLLLWIESQELESLAAIGLLPFIYAAMRGGQRIPEASELASVCKAASVLSEMYLNHLDSSYPIRLTVGRHSGDPPSDWENRDKVSDGWPTKYESNLRLNLQQYERGTPKSLTNQFAYELSVLRELHRDSPMQAFWGQGDREKGYHPGWHTTSHEICLSAYLRTMAWAVAAAVLPEWAISLECSYTSPVDLGLWNVQTRPKPEWWASVDFESSSGADDIETSILVANIEGMSAAWGSGAHVVLAAGGALSQTELKQHNLEIRAFFQTVDGPHRPTSPQLFEHLETVSASISRERSPIVFDGTVSVDTSLERIGDWLILPCSGRATPASPHIWQAWRGIRDIQCPSHIFTEGTLRAVCQDASIDFVEDQCLVGQWSDWSDGLSSLFVAGPRPANGWVLVAPQEVVNEIARQSGMKLAWVWELTSYVMSHSSSEFAQLRAYGEAGVSLVITP